MLLNTIITLDYVTLKTISIIFFKKKTISIKKCVIEIVENIVVSYLHNQS